MAKSAPKTAPSAAPGSVADSAAKKEKKGSKRVPFIAPTKDSEGKDTTPKIKTLEELESYDPKKHQPLKQNHFAELWMFFEFKAQTARKQADHYTAEAERAKKLGAIGDSKKAKRLMALRAQYESLLAELGPDAESLMKELEESE